MFVHSLLQLVNMSAVVDVVVVVVVCQLAVGIMLQHSLNTMTLPLHLLFSGSKTNTQTRGNSLSHFLSNIYPKFTNIKTGALD